MLKIARAALFAVLPAELVLVVLLLSGVSLPLPVIVGAELVVVAVFALEVVTAYRLFRAERRNGLGRRAAAGAAVDRLVPAPVRRMLGFETKGMVSLALWVTRRRNGVPPGATAVPYAREQTPFLLMMVLMMVVETVGLELLLQAIDAPTGLRVVVLVLDAYGVVFGVAVIAAGVTRPHVVTPDELRIRLGAFFDLRIPRRLISTVRLSRNYNEPGQVTLADGRLGVAVSSQTNVIIELTEPVTFVRPLGRVGEATTIRFFADAPDAALRALRPAQREPVQEQV
ncbi:hypothetical protein [Streptosporangium sp. KLBMP 9127]|nr:hypothetical protein [Streptosporangium sp. KLBMP 9127]